MNLPKGYLSYSQVNTYLNCPKLYEYKYVIGEPFYASEDMHIGSIVHNMLDVYMQNKIAGKEQDLRYLVNNYISANLDSTMNAAYVSSEVDEIYDMILESDIISAIKPIETEREMQGEIRGIPFLAYIDLIHTREDGQNEIVDYKVTRRAKSKANTESSLQLAIYSILTQINTVGYISLVKHKQIQHTQATLTESFKSHVEDIIYDVASGINILYFPRCNPENWICSKKWCSCFDDCRGKE